MKVKKEGKKERKKEKKKEAAYPGPLHLTTLGLLVLACWS